MQRRLIVASAVTAAALGFAGSTDAGSAGGGDECIYCMESCEDIFDVEEACSAACGSEVGVCEAGTPECGWDFDDEDEMLLCDGGAN